MISASSPTEISKRKSTLAHADSWLTPGRFAVILGALIIACFPEVIFGFKSFFYRDFGTFGCPLAFYHRQAFWQGRMPFWNPYSLCGVPFMAQWNTLTLYPPSLFYLVFPLSWLPWSLSVFNLAHMYLAGIGMYFLAHRWTGNRLAASVAGLVYAFNGLTWYALMWPNNIAALGWMPWVVLCAEQAWQKGGGRNIALAGLVGAMQMLAGAPEVIILTWVSIGSLWLSEWVRRGGTRGAMLVRIVAVGGLVACLAAAQLVPFGDLLLHSQRDKDFGGSDWSMPVGGWANYLVPLFHLFINPQNIYGQTNQFWTGSYYLGVGSVALAVLAVWRVRQRRTWVLAGLAAFGLTMAWGDRGILYAVARGIFPAMGFMRFPIKFVILPTFVLPLLAAHAVGWWQALPDTQRQLEQKWVWRLGGILLGVMAVIVWWEWFRPHSSQDNPDVITKNALVRVVFLAGILGLFGLSCWIKQPRLQRLAQAALLALFWMDVLTHSTNLSPTVDRVTTDGVQVYQRDLIRQYHVQEMHDPRWDDQLKLGNSRAMAEWATLAKAMYQAQKDPVNDVIGRRLTFFANYNLFDLVPKYDGFFSLATREMDVLDQYSASATTNNDMPHLKDFLSISYIISRTNRMAWTPRDTYMPLITTGQKPVFLEDTNALEVLLSKWFEPAHYVYLPHGDEPLITATAQPDAKIVSSQFDTERVEAQVEARAPAMVVIAQAYYHCWHAYVDGKRTPLLRANYAFQALQVPAGKHEVVLKYEDYGFIAGLVITALSLLACALMWFVAARKQQRWGGAAAPP